MAIRIMLAAVILVASDYAFSQQQPKETPIVKPDAEMMAKIEAKLKELTIASKAVGNDPDVEVYAKAVEWMIRHGEFYGAKAGEQMMVVLNSGLKRAEELKKKPKVPSWIAARGKPVIRGYRSKIDNSVQPYAITVPEGFDPKSKENRLDIVLAGRDGTKTEVKFIHARETAKAVKASDRVVVEPYGRGNNAYRWAGESDVFDVREDVYNRTTLATNLEPDNTAKLLPIDRNRVILRGFSMGGAGTWHLGLHHPSDFAAISPGAGFTVTKGYAKLPDNLPDYVEKCLHIYDAADYAENAFNVPVVAYSGEKDPQIAAARNIEKRLAEANAKPITHIIAPGLEHKQPPEWLKKIDDELAKYLPRKPFQEIKMTTYTPKYGHCDWLFISAMDKQYEKATVTMKWVDGHPKIQTTNVRVLIVQDDPLKTDSLIVDGKQLMLPSEKRGGGRQYLVVKKGGQWTILTTNNEIADFFATAGLMKSYTLQGPIDDAFMSAFHVVGPAGVPMHKDASLYAAASMKRFEREWDKWMRGTLPKSENGHRVLFGDPGSNPAIAEILTKLPIKWTDSELIVNGVKYDPKTHVPVMIYPDPKNPRNYVVINSGHTFHDADFKGTNALLFPKLGDWAVMKPTPTKDDPAKAEVVAAGLFDENWQFASPQKPKSP